MSGPTLALPYPWRNISTNWSVCHCHGDLTICICGYCLISYTLQQSITQLHYQLNSNSTYNISLKATSMMVCNRKQHSEECLKINAVQGKALHTLEILLWMLWTPDTPHVINMYKLYFSCGPFYSNSYGPCKNHNVSGQGKHYITLAQLYSVII